MLIKRKTQSSDTDDSSIVRTMKTLTLHFPDMCCPVEFGPVEHALAALSSDIRAVPDYSVRRVKINVPDRSPLEKNAILAAVSKTGQSFDVAASSGWSDDPSFDRVRITVPEMDCPVEAGEIERELKKAGITDYQIDIMNRRILTSPAAASGVMAAVRSAGYEGSIDAADTAADNRVRIAVPEMDCPVEAGEIERELKKAGIADYEIDIMNRRILTSGDTAHGVLAAVKAAGYEGTLEAEASASTAKGQTLLSVPEMDCPVAAGEIERELKKAGIADYEIDIMNRRILTSGDAVHGVMAAVKAAGYEGTLEAEASASTAKGQTLLSVPEMDCPVEAGEIEREFNAAGIKGYEINVMNRTIAVPAAAAAAAQAAISAAGYESTVMKAREQETVFEDRTPWKRYILALIIALGCEFFEVAADNGYITLDEFLVKGITLALAVLAIFMVGLTTFKKGIQSVMKGTLNMNTLMAVAVTGGVLIGAWPEAAMVLVLFEISEAIEQLSMTRARRSIRDLMSVAPEKALVAQGSGKYVEMKVESVGPGAQVRIAPGDRVPLDGKIVEGTTTLDQSMVTGESMPAEKGPGATVWAGTVNLTSTIEVTVTAAASQSLTARIIEAVENAQSSKSPVQRFVDKFAAVYTPIVFVVALCVAIVPPLFLGDWLGWLYKALCLLVIACPCALVISTPVTIVSALATATRCGLLIKGGLFLEEARKLTNIGLDKTGTLTKGEPEVAGITLLGGADRKQVLSLAASLGAMNKHPLSAAIVREAKKEHAEIQPVADFTALPGEGVTGRIGTGRASLLNLAALDKRGLSSDEVADAFNRASENGMSSVALADTFGVLAVFVMADEIKADTRSGLAQLKAEGITPWLLTGDNERAAHALAGKLGLENVNADLLPEAKLARIRELQGQGLTAMVGDGINDAPALAQADIGIAMGVRGTDSAIEAADIAVMDDRISSVATLVRLSRMTHSVLVQNIAFALGIKIIFTILAISGFATMWMAVFADTGTCLIVVANGMRLMRVKPKLDRMAAEVDRAAGTAPQTHVQTAAA